MKKVVIILSILLLAISLSACSNNKDGKDKKSDSDVGSIFDSRSEQSIDTRDLTVNSGVANRFNINEQKKFYDLSTTGVIDLASPESYLSPRWNAIIGPDRDFGLVPISELDNPENSDLSKNDFNYFRDTAVKIFDAEMTGVNAQLYPSYFSNISPRGCSNFTLENAGAIRLPITNDGTWVKAFVIARAKCENFEEVHTAVNLQYDQIIYFNYSNGQWLPYSTFK